MIQSPDIFPFFYRPQDHLHETPGSRRCPSPATGHDDLFSPVVVRPPHQRRQRNVGRNTSSSIDSHCRPLRPPVTASCRRLAAASHWPRPAETWYQDDGVPCWPRATRRWRMCCWPPSPPRYRPPSLPSVAGPSCYGWDLHPHDRARRRSACLPFRLQLQALQTIRKQELFFSHHGLVLQPI